MNIRKKLQRVVTLQDCITHLNENGGAYTIEFGDLKDKRNSLIDEITTYVDWLQDAVGEDVWERYEL